MPVKKSFLFSTLFFWGMFLIWSPLQVGAAPEDNTVLLEYPTSIPDEGKTPLILIHGIHGNQVSGTVNDDVDVPNWNYWHTFLNFFYCWDDTGLKDRYKLYGFFYESDKIPVEDIGRELKEKIEIQTDLPSSSSHSVEDVPFVILAHSMGGLVARSFMNETLDSGNSAGEKAGERVLGLITLATPHHGSPAANNGCRNLLVTGPVWAGVFEVADLLWWKNEYDVDNSKEPNRSDLRWDDFDQTMEPVGYFDVFKEQDKNTWLRRLNSFTGFDRKVITYSGVIDPETPLRQELVNGGPVAVGNHLRKYKKIAKHRNICTGISLKEGLLDGIYGDNDGVVPFSSALFAGHVVKKARTLSDFNHDEMKGDGLNPSQEKYTRLFAPLASDLNKFLINISTAPETVRALNGVVFSIEGALDENAIFEWTFHDGTTSSNRSAEFVFPKPGTYNVTLKISDPELGSITRSRQVKVYLPDFDVQGRGTLKQAFTAPASDLISQIQWKISGNGSLVQGDLDTSSCVYRFDVPGSYMVSLALDLDDGSQLDIAKWIHAGGGPFYVYGVTGDETWAGNSRYIAPSGITIAEGASLTIEPGARVEMGYQSQFKVIGTLTATGVTFTSTDPSSYWGNMLISGSGAGSSRLENCTVEYAGSCSGFGIKDTILIIDGCSPAISGSTVLNSSPEYRYKYSVRIDNGSPLISGNTFDKSIVIGGNSAPVVVGNTLDRLSLDGNLVEGVDGIYKFNTLNGIQVHYGGGNSPEIGSNTFLNNGCMSASGLISSHLVWGEGGCNCFSSIPDIDPGGSLIIAPGKTVNIDEDLSIYGTLKASGVTFRVSDRTDKINFYGSGTGSSVLENCTFESPGNLPYSSPGISIREGSAPVFKACTIKDNIYFTINGNPGDAPAIIDSTISGTPGTDEDEENLWGTAISVNTGSPIISGNTIKGFANAVEAAVSDDDPESSPRIIGNKIKNNSWGFGLRHHNVICRDNILKDNDYGISIYFSEEGSEFGSNTYEGNRKADLVIAGSIHGHVAENALLYQVDRSFEIAEGGRLEFSPGSTVTFGKDVRIHVLGALYAEKTRFIQGVPNSFQVQDAGLVFNGADASRSGLINCFFEDIKKVSLINTDVPVTGCTFSGVGLSLAGSTAHIVSNRFDGAGIGISGDSHPVIIGNEITGTGPYSSGGGTGISIGGSVSAVGNIIKNLSYGIYIYLWQPPAEGADILIRGNKIKDNHSGIFIQHFEDNRKEQIDKVQINGNSISGSREYGIYWNVYKPEVMLNAVNNYWGDPNGPLDDDDDRLQGGLYNPDGLGDSVDDYVNYSPWLFIDVFNISEIFNILGSITGGDVGIVPAGTDVDQNNRLGIQDAILHLNQLSNNPGD